MSAFPPNVPEKIIICIEADAGLFQDDGSIGPNQLSFRTHAQSLRHGLMQFLSNKSMMHPRTEFALAIISDSYILMQSMTSKVNEFIDAYDSCMMPTTFSSTGISPDYRDMMTDLTSYSPRMSPLQSYPEHTARLLWIYCKRTIPKTFEYAIPKAPLANSFIDVLFLHGQLSPTAAAYTQICHAIMDSLSKSIAHFPKSMCIEAVFSSVEMFERMMLLLGHPLQRSYGDRMSL
eukprot:TRINITY_DN868_c0_g1_i7.p1 TRINITY_DN868_c0_g1~~TRINITY_DN868_c0_g1_i7.p1  ORF type:complete len:233 (+),score=38.33 TRINITY_DN868_c0_g1_i7:331-1029(+)